MTAVVDPSARDLALLQGCWEQVAMEADGRIDAPDMPGAHGALTTIRGHRFEVHTPAGERLLAGRFELDATGDPGAITWIDATGPDAGKRLPASYRLEANRFVFIAADEGSPRPRAFSTAPGQVMRSFVRRAPPAR